jgi:hypothetical protein
MHHPRVALLALGLAAASVTACTSKTVIQVVAPSTTVGDATTSEIEEETTSVTTAPATTPAATTAPATTPPSTEPPATEPPATQPPAPTDPPTTAAPSLELYDEVDPPDAPDGHTDSFEPSGDLDDGVYWVVYNGGETFTPDITLYVAYFGAECESKAIELGLSCDNDYLVPEDPFRDIDDLPFADDVVLTVSDQNTQKSYWITPDELRTIRASSPSDGAPDDFGFSSFPFLMTVEDEEIVAFEQLWVP